MAEKTVYIKAEQCVAVHNRKILLEDVVKIYGSDKKLVKELNQEILFTVTEDKCSKFVFSILKVIELLEKQHPGLTVNNIGDTDFIVEYSPPKPISKAVEYMKLCFICLAIFFGAGFTIMTFNEDVSVGDTFNLFYELVKEEMPERGGIMEIAYAIGLPIGIIVFYNHFSKIRLNSDPTPLQVQLRVYEEEVNKAIIENISREGKVQDAD